MIDTEDPGRVVPFWQALLGVEVREDRDDGHYVTLAPAPTLSGAMMLCFQRVPEAKTGKNRAYVDVWVDDLDAGTARVEELGGRLLTPRGTTLDDGGWLSRVVADPEGNEFCIALTPTWPRT